MKIKIHPDSLALLLQGVDRGGAEEWVLPFYVEKRVRVGRPMYCSIRSV